jgi:deoxyribodipyrimidine photo-lyase
VSTPSILWFRQDLRLHDHPALLAAAAVGPVIPVYILDDDSPGEWRIGGAQRWWLHHSLAALAASLEAIGSRLILRRGRSAEVLQALLEETEAGQVHASTQTEPWWRASETVLGNRLCLHDGSHLVRLEDVATASGSHFRIYSAFWRALQSHLPPEEPKAAPDHLPAPDRWPRSDALNSWALLPTRPNWAKGFGEVWTPGEQDALRKVAALTVERYEDQRNLPAESGTSRLSPHLHFGELSPKRLWHAVSGQPNADKFLKELAWRDFTAALTLDLPHYGDRHGRPKFDRLPWRNDGDDLTAWQRGRTGYPIVDAGLRELWATGWMHNRVRMIAASFLVKHLLIDWRQGAHWFWDCLVDADYGNNSVNWQWVAGTGIDANMWGRIMAPIAQSEKFGAGDYIRHWVPELAHLPESAIHDPDAAGCRPDDYPAPVIGHRAARERALAAGRSIR